MSVGGGLMGVVSSSFVSEGASPSDQKMRVVIIGGGPGGLFTAWQLQAKAGVACEITVFESNNRVGGKIVSREMPGIGPYEAGVAEIYDYSRIGPDPLRRLIVNELGLDIKTLSGGPCVLGGKIALKPEDLAQHFGQEAADEAIAFRKKCTEMLTPRGYYLSIAETDNEHPWRDITGAELLNTEIRSDAARRYVRAMAHSDVAAPPYHTDGLTFLKNAVMDLDGYMDIFSVVGGNEQIIDKLEEELDAQVRMNAHVRAVQPLADGTYRVEVDAEGFLENHIADFVVVALPLSAMACVTWRSDRLQRVIDDHIAYFDRPGHYLRATLAFKRPFWRDHLPADWWMSDAFDGCCIYDESARNNLERYGMLAFLIAGNAALSLANESDERIEQMCLDALPASLGDARDHFIEGRIHRWMASVNAIPGGKRVRRRIENHRPDPEHLPGVLIVGDYLFDSTLNGVMDSADAASDIIVGETLKRRRDRRSAAPAALPDAAPTEKANLVDVLAQFIPADLMTDIMRIVWDLPQGARILNFGSMSGSLVGALRSLGYDAWGVEHDPVAHAATPQDLAKFNLLVEGGKLPFPDRDFFAVIDTGLYRLPTDGIDRAVRDLGRVTRHGLFLGSLTLDLSIDVIERYDLMKGAEFLGSRWDWSERLYPVGFTHALLESPRLDTAWARAQEAGAGHGHWFEDIEAILYCFFALAQPAVGAANAGEAHRERAL